MDPRSTSRARIRSARGIVAVRDGWEVYCPHCGHFIIQVLRAREVLLRAPCPQSGCSLQVQVIVTAHGEECWGVDRRPYRVVG